MKLFPKAKYQIEVSMDGGNSDACILLQHSTAERDIGEDEYSYLIFNPVSVLIK